MAQILPESRVCPTENFEKDWFTMNKQRFVLILLLSILCSACSVTRKLSQGEYLLQRVEIDADHSVPKTERIGSLTLEEYVRQTPNKPFLGTNFYVWAYNLANPEKDNWWNNLKRKVG